MIGRGVASRATARVNVHGVIRGIPAFTKEVPNEHRHHSTRRRNRGIGDDMSLRFRVCKACRGRFDPDEGRYCYVRPLPGHNRSDWVCVRCRSAIAAEGRAASQSEPAPQSAPQPERSLPPAGWYRNGDFERWWDGVDWTEHTR